MVVTLVVGPVGLSCGQKAGGAICVSKVASRRGEKEYVSWLVRRSFRDGDKVGHETLANLSALPSAAIEAVRASLSGNDLMRSSGRGVAA
jgi:hypothetical protein